MKEALITRMLKKDQKGWWKSKSNNHNDEGDAEQNMDLASDNWLKIKINPRRVKIGDKILVSDEVMDHLC